MARPCRSETDLEQAALHVSYELTSLAEMAAELVRVHGARDLHQNALLESFLVHNRNLINFIAGGYKGSRDSGDIQPADFLGYDWWPGDEEYDRRIRGRLPVINQNLQHLSWARVQADDFVMWPMGFLAHETTWGMRLFVAELRKADGRRLGQFELSLQIAHAALPPFEQKPQTTAPMAPPRK